MGRFKFFLLSLGDQLCNTSQAQAAVHPKSSPRRLWRESVKPCQLVRAVCGARRCRGGVSTRSASSRTTKHHLVSQGNTLGRHLGCNRAPAARAAGMTQRDKGTMHSPSEGTRGPPLGRCWGVALCEPMELSPWVGTLP